MHLKARKRTRDSSQLYHKVSSYRRWQQIINVLINKKRNIFFGATGTSVPSIAFEFGLTPSEDLLLGNLEHAVLIQCHDWC